MLDAARVRSVAAGNSQLPYSLDFDHLPGSTLIVQKAISRLRHEQKNMLMRVGFEPTPFRTSDVDVPGGITLS